MTSSAVGSQVAYRGKNKGNWKFGWKRSLMKKNVLRNFQQVIMGNFGGKTEQEDTKCFIYFFIRKKQIMVVAGHVGSGGRPAHRRGIFMVDS